MNSKKYPNFRTHVFWIIRSHIDNLAHKQWRTGVNETTLGDDDPGNPLYRELAERWSDQDYEKFVQQCLRALSTDEDGWIVFLSLSEGRENSEAALDIGLSVEAVENIKKRIKRKLAPVFARHFEQIHSKKKTHVPATMNL